jgi:hypothetical protein
MTAEAQGLGRRNLEKHAAGGVINAFDFRMSGCRPRRQRGAQLLPGDSAVAQKVDVDFLVLQAAFDGPEPVLEVADHPLRRARDDELIATAGIGSARWRGVSPGARRAGIRGRCVARGHRGTPGAAVDGWLRCIRCSTFGGRAVGTAAVGASGASVAFRTSVDTSCCAASTRRATGPGPCGATGSASAASSLASAARGSASTACVAARSTGRRAAAPAARAGAAGRPACPAPAAGAGVAASAGARCAARVVSSAAHRDGEERRKKPRRHAMCHPKRLRVDPPALGEW